MEANGYTDENLRALAKKIAGDLYGENDDCFEDTADDVYRTLKKTESWDDGAVLASQFCHFGGDQISDHVVGTFACTQAYGYLIKEHGPDCFDRIFRGNRKRKMN